MVTNEDNAQLLYYGSSTIQVGSNAPIIQPGQSLKINLSPSSDLYGICIGPASIAVGISSLDLPYV